ncbi:hypothetical protein [Gaoshiqia sediminis]|uniref:Uncharacterized protein n=1 Tax=Gaoshiqia sediminis TaxID=2986998 RepID=A0AA41Y8U3_9BACT|nr:hypothetical protein [Gaoshiqia sediminis]MCW0483322.1 hypothetical protein [Gaoshiqia sediminis]
MMMVKASSSNGTKPTQECRRNMGQWMDMVKQQNVAKHVEMVSF